jgi:hypothetical protein
MTEEEAWMLAQVFQQRGAYPYPFGSDTLGWLYAASDQALDRLSLPRLRDQAAAEGRTPLDQITRFLQDAVAAWQA